MRTPRRAKGSAPQQRVSVSKSYPAPLGGWNDRDALAAMKPTDAIVLENWFPKTSYLEIRGGSADHKTGMTLNVSTLAAYNSPSGTNKLFGSTATAVYDVSSAGAIVDNYMLSPGASGDYASTPDSVVASVTGDIDIRVKVALDDWTPAAISTLLAKSTATADQRSYALSVKTDGTLQLQTSPTGTAAALVTSASTVAPTVANGAALWVRVTLDVDDGAGGNVVKFYTSSDGTTWTQLGTTVTNAGTTSIYDSTTAVEIGSRDAGTTQVSAGKFYVAQVYSGAVKKLEFAAADAPAGVTSIIGFATGEVWTINGAATLVGSSVASRTNGKHQCLNFGDGTNNYLMMFNGVDSPLYYNGSAWLAVTVASSPALTGLDPKKIISAFDFKGRLMVIEKDSLSFWYLAAGAAGGALTRFQLDGEAKKGGYLVAGATWTFDGGSGIDDAAVFVTSEGEVIVYKGTNPGSATTWAKVGSYTLGKPIGRRCLINYASDLILLCQDGAFPLSAALQSATVDDRVSLSDKISNSFNVSALTLSGVFGWEATLYSTQSALIFNIPKAEGGVHEQYVMNTITKSWCKFVGWNAECFAVFNNELYYGAVGKVVKAWTGVSDNGADIVTYGKMAFSHFGRPASQKRINMYRPTLAVNGSIDFLTDVDVDFQDTTINGTATYTVINGAKWDTGQWDTSYWAAGVEVVRNWTSPQTIPGIYIAGKIKIWTNQLTVQWMSNEYVFEEGGVL